MTGGLQENKEYRKGGIWDWGDSGLEGYRKRGKQERRVQYRRDRRNTGQVGCRTVWMQDRSDAGKERGRKHAGQEGGRKGGRHERMDAGNE